MSETSKMGLFGSKEGNTSSNTGQLSKDESPERYAPYSVDSDSETYDTEALSIMDINDIIGIQTEPVGESTLESEIAALSEIITDTNIPGTTTENNASEDVKTIPTTNVDSLENIEEKKADTSGKVSVNQAGTETDSNIDGIKNDTNKCISIAETPPLDTKGIKEVNDSTGLKDVTAISKSLQLIGEAYDSDDSQESDSDEMQIGKEPKVVFSCKPFVEKQSCKVTEKDDCETVQSIIIESAINSTSVVDDSVANQMVKENVSEEVKVNEEAKVSEEEKVCDDVEENKEKSDEEFPEEILSENSDCKKIIDVSSNDVREDSTEARVNEAPNVNEVLSDENSQIVEDLKSPMDTIDDAVETDSTPIVEDTVLLPDNLNHEIEKESNVMAVEIEQEEKTTPQDEVEKMEVDINAEASSHNDESCVEPESKNELKSHVESNKDVSSDKVNEINENDPFESVESSAVLVAELTELSVRESEVESEPTAATTLEKTEKTIDENLTKADDENTNNVNCPEGILSEPHEPVVTDSETVPEPIINEAIEDVVCIESPVDESQGIILDDSKVVEVEAMQQDIPEIDDKSEAIDENPVSEEDFPAQIEESDKVTHSEPEEKPIVDEPKAPESSSENEQSEECADSTSEFVDALSPTQFATENIAETVENQKSQADIFEKIDEEVDNEKSSDPMDNFDEVNDEENQSNSEVSHDQPASPEHFTEVIDVIPDPELNELNDESPEEEEDKLEGAVEESIAAEIEAEITQLETTEPTNELSSTNTSELPATPESKEQVITALKSTTSELLSTCDEANIIKPVEETDLDKSLEKITTPLTEEIKVLPENYSPDVSQSLDKISDPVNNAPDLNSLLEDPEIQGEENEVTEPVSFSEDISSATSNVINDIKQNLLTQSDELLEHALKEPIAVHTDDSLDGILDLDLIPNIEEAVIKSAETMIENIVENVPEEMDTIEKESPLELLLPDPRIVAVDQAADFLMAVVDTVDDTDNKVIDADSKIKDDSAMETVPSIDEEQEEQAQDNFELKKEQVLKDLLEDENDIESPELEIPFTLTEEDKLEIPDEILNDPLATVDSDIGILQADTEIPNVILNNPLAAVDSSIVALEVGTEIANDILNVPLIDVNSEIAELQVNAEISDDILDDPLTDVDTGLVDLRKSTEIPNDILDDPLTAVDSGLEELPINTEIPNDILDDPLAVVDSAIEELQADMEISNDLLNEPLAVVASDMEELQENVVISHDVLNDPLVVTDSGIEVLQGNTEISELESAVKFLQESEDHEIESLPVLSPKMIEDVADKINHREDSPTVYSSNQEMCEDSSDLVTELETITTESIAISEAEIINEAAKLESEKKLSEEVCDASTQQANIVKEDKISDDVKKQSKNETIIAPVEAISINIHDAAVAPTPNILPVKSSIIPKTSILEERLREPPKIEIPIVDPPRLCDMPTTPKTSLLIPRDSRMSNYQKMMESPKSSLEKSSRDELKITDTPRRDSEKLDIENVGSPRIILKIAKSALADCAEPRSPKSPKIRSATNSPNPEDSPGQKLGKIKLKLSKGCHPSIISNDNIEESALQWHTEGSSSLSPLGMKIKLSKSGDASIVQHELKETPKHMLAGSPRRTESPLGMKIKLSKSGDASIIQPDKLEDETSREARIREKTESSQDTMKRTDSPLGMKIKLLTTGDASIVSVEHDESKDLKIKEKSEFHQDNQKRTDSHVGMKIKLSKKGGATIIPSNDKEKIEMPKSPRRTESPLGMKIKLSKTGDASIIHSELVDDQITTSSYESTPAKDIDSVSGTTKRSESSIGMKIKLSKDGDATIVHTEKQQEEEQQDIKRIDSTIGMKIKLSKSGDASIIQSQTNELHEERNTEIKAHKSSDTTTIESMKIRLSKTGHGTIVANDSDTSQRSKEFIESHHIFTQKREQLVNRSEVTIEPIQLARRSESTVDISPKRKDSVTLSPIEMKKAKMDNKLSQMLPEVTIQPIAARDQKQIHFDQSNSSAISRQQLNVISQEISITQLRPNKPAEFSVSEKLRKMLTKPPSNSAEECEIIEHQPELIIVNENSNSSQDIMIIDEVPPLRMPEVKIPRKRGRPRRNAIAMQFQQPPMQIPPDPLALDDVPHQLVNNLGESKEYERPRRTCRSQKSYAPPRRGRGRGRGKRKFDKIDSPVGKRARLEQNLVPMDDCSTALITLDDEVTDDVPNDSSELYKALRQPLKGTRMDMLTQNPVACTVALKNRVDALLEPRLMARLEGRDPETTPTKTIQVQSISDQLKKDSKDTFGAPDNQNWLTPSSKKNVEINRNDGISTVQVIDEETRMSAESFSRSQTPARNMSVNAAETTINEESQGSVLSTATTESEKVKVRNRRMEISFDPDEGPFTVDKIAEYEWPIDRKGETFMIQEQISQYLGVKSFKRKYPDLKRRMVDMEERNFLRENILVSEGMCDMGLTAIYSSEVLDIMCSDFPDQYEEYRKHMREKQIKEHSKKQKELSAAATAEKNRIDLAEMAVQSALSWNVNLNKARRESRRCSLDLQTFTIHVPKKLQKIEEESKVSHYPVALIPGQYTDYYREYTPAELRYYPLNTVLYGPMRPNERKFDSQSEGSQSDSDTDSSSDDSSCSSSEGTQDTEESQSTMDDVDIELSNQKDKSLKCKMCLKNLNKNNKTEVLIQCGTCSGHVHPSCIDLTLDMVPHIQAYAWQCTDCKTCAQCHDPADEDKMLFCDMCDRGYHIYCVGLRRVPQGRWHCQECAICASCGSREAGGVNADRNSVALWQHEYKKGDKNTRVYVSTLCVPCSKLWRKGRYCPHCSRCHTVPRLDMDENLVHCSACDKYLHLECVESKDLIIDRKNYHCDLCIQNRQRIVKPSVSKVIRA